jgi:RhtX/FptX family siderophore transporter
MSSAAEYPHNTAHRWLLIAALYFAQGIPLGLAMEALPALLRRQGTSLESLAFLPLVGLPWVLKFLWAAPVDNHWQPALGRRRSWIVPMQSLVLFCLLAAAGLGVSGATALAIVALAAVGSLASATQDIATDGLTAEHFSGPALARANALQVGGTMVGFFFGGSGCLLLTGLLGVRGALAVLALPVAASLLLALAWREGASGPVRMLRPPARLRHFIARPGAWPLLLAAALSAMAAVTGYGLSKLLLVDAGWPLEDVGRVGMVGGGITVLLGCGGGAWLAGRIGARALFALGIAASALAAALWLWLAGQTPALLVTEMRAGVWAATALGCFGAGSASVAVMTLAMAFAAQGTQAGTDMTAVQSARDVGEIATSSSLTGLAAHAGYAGSFAAGLAVALAALVVAARLGDRNR